MHVIVARTELCALAVVLLGAGMDSRAFRMDWPESTRLFEVDTSAPLDFKASVLRQESARSRRQAVGWG